MLAWQVWRMSGKRHLPTRAEIEELEHSWVSDIFFVEETANWLSNDTPAMSLAQPTLARGRGGESNDNHG